MACWSSVIVEIAIWVSMVILVAMAILGVVVNVQREMGSSVQWLSLFRNAGGGSPLCTWRGVLCQILLVPVAMWFVVSQVFSSRISPQLLHFLLLSISACTWWVGISCLSFLFMVENSLSTAAIVVMSVVLRLLERLGRTVGIFGVPWAQFSPLDHSFPIHLTNLRNCVDSISSTLFVMVHAMHPPPSPLIPSLSVFPMSVWTGGLPAPDVRHSIHPPALNTPP